MLEAISFVLCDNSCVLAGSGVRASPPGFSLCAAAKAPRAYEDAWRNIPAQRLWLLLPALFSRMKFPKQCEAGNEPSE